MNIELKKDIEVCSKTGGNYWLRCITLKGKYSNELFTKETILKLKSFAEKQGYTGRDKLHNWFKKNRPAIFKSSITDADSNKLMHGLIDILKDFEL